MPLPPVRSMALAAASVAMALAIFYHFNFNLKLYMEPLKDRCGLNGPATGVLGYLRRPPPHYKLGVKFIDALHCLITPFFLDCVAQPAGRFWVIKTLEACVPLIALLALEESRSSARGPARASVLVMLLAQLLGVSVALPLLWLAPYLLLTAPRVDGAFLPAGKVPAIAAAQALTALLTAPLVLASKLAPLDQQKVVVLFNLGLPFLGLIWMVTPGGSKAGNAAAARMLRGLAALAFAMHAWSVADMASSHGGSAKAAWRALAEVAGKATARVQPANFMQFDFIGVFASALIFLFAEEGAAAAAEALCFAPVIGPGAAVAIGLARREERLALGAAKRPLRAAADKRD